MDSTTNNTAAYWIAGIIVVLAIILGAWLLTGGTGGAGVPNTGAQTQTTGTLNAGAGGTGSTGANY